MGKKTAKDKGGNKKKKSTGKTKEEKPLYLPLIYEIPKYEDPKETTEKVKITTCLAEPETALFRIKNEYYVDTRIESIVKEVRALHQDSIMHVKVSRSQHSFQECLQHHRTLQSYGITGQEEFFLFYDYKPICHPLLE